MSMIRCENCGAPIDSDDDPDCFVLIFDAASDKMMDGVCCARCRGDSALDHPRDYLGERGILSDAGAIQFIEVLRDKLNVELPLQMTEQSKRMLDDIAYRHFQEMEANGGILMPEDGMRIVGVVLRSLGSTNNLTAYFRTAFYPWPHFKEQPGGCIALGFYLQRHPGHEPERFDLWIGKQPPLPPTLIGRYGNGPSQYSTWNPDLLDLRTAPPWAIEALRRAREHSIDGLDDD